MSDAESAAPVGGTPAPRSSREWFWRFLALLMLISALWVAWIAYQLSAPSLALPAAFEAAAKARASRNSAGTIGAAPASVAASAPVEAGAAAASTPAEAPPGALSTPPALAASTPAEVREPPVNLDKLRLTDSIATPIPERPRRAAKPAAQ